MLFHILFADNSASHHGLQVAQLTDETGADYTFLLDFDEAYLSMADICQDIAERLAVAVTDIELEEV